MYRAQSVAALPGRANRVSRPKDPNEARNDAILRFLAGVAPVAGGAIGGLAGIPGGPAGVAAGITAGAGVGQAVGTGFNQAADAGYDEDEEDRELRRQERWNALMSLRGGRR